MFSQNGSSTPSLLVPVNRLTHQETFCTPNIDPTQHDTQDVRRLLRGQSKSPEDSNWTVRIAHSLTSCAPFPCQSGVMTGPSCQCPDMPQHAKRCSHPTCFVDGVSHQAMLVSCHATSCSTDALPDHIMSLRTLQCLACGWSLLGAFAVQRKSADAPWRERHEQLSTPLLVGAPCHINQTLSRGASVPDISGVLFRL